MIRLQQILKNLEGELVNAQAEGWSREACVSVVQELAIRWNVYVPRTKEEAEASLARQLLESSAPKLLVYLKQAVVVTEQEVGKEIDRVVRNDFEFNITKARQVIAEAEER